MIIFKKKTRKILVPFQSDTGALLAIEMMRSQSSLMNSANCGLSLELGQFLRNKYEDYLK